MESTGLWNIKGSEEYIYGEKKNIDNNNNNRSDEGISWTRGKLTLDSDMP